MSLAYGFVWSTGKSLMKYMLQNTGSSNLDYTRVAGWALGEGEWDGCNELWINDTKTWTSEWDDPTQFHFHRGADAVIGSGLTPSSVGPDQGVDSFFSSFPSAVQPLTFNRIACYFIKRKQPIPHQANTHQDDPSQWTDCNPVGLWRALRTRIFDDQGRMTGYAFNTNCAWHFVDVLLRRKIMQDYNISLSHGPDDLTPEVRARFDWGSISEAAQYFDDLLANGRRRFTGSYAFSTQTSLNAILEQILLCCRSYMQEYAGKIYLVCDKPRPSVFIFSRQHVLSLEPNDQALHATANRFIGKFRDLLIPTAATIASISCADHRNPVVTTELPHCFSKDDALAIGGTDSPYDGTWVIASVPSGTSVNTLTLRSKGLNYPAYIGAGGKIGLMQSRFKERTVQYHHKANQLARGAIGLNLPRVRNKVKQEMDFSVSTFDQVSRITKYERMRQLGPDTTPYVTPPTLALRVPFFSQDANGHLAPAVQPGDHVTVDDTASFPYAGEYEVLDREVVPPSVRNAGGGASRGPDSEPGEIRFTLGNYSDDNFPDSSDDEAASWSSVPGSDPGNDGFSTTIDLSGNGLLTFFSGALASGSVIQLPSLGFNPSNFLNIVSPQGYIERGHPMHVIQQCAADANRRIALNYEDGSRNVWNGDLNYLGMTWRAGAEAASTLQIGTMTFLVATLLGGEKVCIGTGVMADGGTVLLPDGFTLNQAFAIATPHDTPAYAAGDNRAHGVGSFVDAQGVVHLNYQDGEGHVWHGNAGVFVFAWQNNSGAVQVANITGGKWATITLPNGMTFGAGCATLASGTKFEIPASAGNANSLQGIVTPRTFDIVDHPAHGVGACYLDVNAKAVLMFEDGEGHQWGGTADVLALFYERGAVSVALTPNTAIIAPSATQQFTATVTGSDNTAVSWNVDGIAGGSSAVGTIDANGLYTAPAAGGQHAVTATSQASATSSSSAIITVSGSQGVTLAITPSYASLSPWDQTKFAATVSGSSSQGVNWFVNGMAGGNTTVGTIAADGTFTAYGSGTFRITAVWQGDPSVSGSASVSVGSTDIGDLGGGTRVGCPVDSMWLDPEMQAAAIIVGQEADCLHRETSEGYRAPLLRRRSDLAECVRLTAADGTVFECSVTTPFELPDGVTIWSPNMLGKPVATDAGPGTPIGWSSIIKLERIGAHPVSLLDFGGRIFAAGKEQNGRRMYSHNIAKTMAMMMDDTS